MVEPRPALIRGQVPGPERPEFAEYSHAESGESERRAKAHAPDAEEPWLKVREDFEPGPPYALAALEADRDLRALVRGRVLDVGAGTCWLSAWASRFPAVEQVYAVDLSERFLTTVGERVYRREGGDPRKLTLVASDFNDLPLAGDSIEAAFLCAALHHSLAPLRTLHEIRRCLAPEGVLFVIEGPATTLRIRQARERALSISGEVSEIAYTREELEYLFAVAGFSIRRRLASGPLSSRWPRRVLRQALRRIDLEHVVLGAPTYLYLLAQR